MTTCPPATRTPVAPTRNPSSISELVRQNDRVHGDLARLFAHPGKEPEGAGGTVSRDLDRHEPAGELDPFVDRLGDELRLSGKGRAVLGAGDRDGLRAEPQAAAGGVEGGVAAPDHDHPPSDRDRLARGAGAQQLGGRDDTRPVRSGKRRGRGTLATDGEQHRLVTGGDKGVHGEVRPATLAGPELDAVGEHAPDLLVEQLAWQTELRDETTQLPARFGLRLEDSDVVAEPGELPRRGEPRGAGAHDGDLLLVHRRGGDDWGRRRDVVGDEAPDAGDRDGLVDPAPRARGLALVATDPAAHARERVLPTRQLVGVGGAPLGDEGGNPLGGGVHRADRHTGRPAAVVDREPRGDRVGERPSDRLALRHAEVEGALQLDRTRRGAPPTGHTALGDVARTVEHPHPQLARRADHGRHLGEGVDVDA